MSNQISNQRMKDVKEQSRGASCDMSPDAVERRLEIVDELRELARELQNAKRLGPIDPIEKRPGLASDPPYDRFLE